MYTITFTYLKANNVTEVDIIYRVIASSYREAVDQVQIEADKRIAKIGGTIVSIR